MLERKEFFNQNSVCIFTDASFTMRDNIPSTCAGACVYIDGLLIDQDFHIYHNCSSQRGELYAILMGVYFANKYSNFKNINLFSDSLNSVLAYRSRIFKWINHDNFLGEHGSVQNQDIIMDTIYTIDAFHIPINFIHVKGHVDINNKKLIKESKEMFQRSNGVMEDISLDLIKQIAIGNNQVDNYTRYMLNYYYNDPRYWIQMPAITFTYNNTEGLKCDENELMYLTQGG